jgi:hypothetical protein
MSGVGECRLGCSSTIETQHPTESLDAADRCSCRFGILSWLYQSIVESLVIPLLMIVNGVFASGPDFTDAYSNFAVVHRRQGHPDLALDPYILALGIDPDNASLRNNLLVLYGQLAAERGTQPKRDNPDARRLLTGLDLLERR